MQRVHLQFGIAEPMAQLGNLSLIAIIQMLAGAEDLNQRDLGVPDPVQPYGGQPVIRKQMCGEDALNRN